MSLPTGSLASFLGAVEMEARSGRWDLGTSARTDQQPFLRSRCSARKSFAQLEGPGEVEPGDVASRR